MVDRPKVLYIDDESGNLLVFKSNLKNHLEIRTATSGKEGLEILDEEEIPVVIADQRMPEMSGAEFLAEVRRRHPDTMRMIVTAHTSFDDVVQAINEGQVTRFIQKPWESHDLLMAVRQAAELYYQIKENRTLSQQLLHKQRLAAIGQVTSGLVHELSNIAVVFTAMEELEECMRRGEDVSELVRMVRSSGERFTVLVDGLRVYASGGDELRIIPRNEDLNDVIEKSLRFLRLFEPVRQLCDLSVAPNAVPLLVPIDRKKIEQVIINVVKNAAEAAPTGAGMVKIALRQEESSAIVEISDNGPGIPDAVAGRIWQGFYSTKGTVGTGLGLMMCKKIIEAHQGSIEYSNGPTGGCVFTLKLPRDAG